MTTPPESTKKNKKSSSQTIMRFSSVALQMGLIIGLGAWGGTQLDLKVQNEKPIWTIVLTLLGVAIALYLVIKEALKLSNED